MARALQTLSRMRRSPSGAGSSGSPRVATSAVREADNGKAFVDRVRP
jgi:exopolyphosphatase/pppGpp-phosphohydrolase